MKDNSRSLTTDEIADMLISPYYAIRLDDGLFGAHPPLVDEATWVKANVRLIEELGPEEYLRKLLDVLKNGGPGEG